MEARSVDEYWTMVGYRDYWGRELSSLSSQAAVLEDRIAALQRAIDGMHAQEEILRGIVSEITGLPSACGLWQGARAREFFSQCTDGGLYGIYKSTLDAAAEAIRELEAALQKCNTQFEEVQAGCMEADRNYAFWDQKVAGYW